MEAVPTVMTALPPFVALLIFALLPVDARARCATVCRGWRALLADPSLWTRLDLSDASGITCRVSDRVLRGAAARAGGALQALDARRVSRVTVFTDEALLHVVMANVGTLRELRVAAVCAGPVFVSASDDALTLLLRAAAPELRTLSADAVTGCSPEQAPALLRNELPYGPLRMQTLSVVNMWQASLDDTSVLALAAALPAHASLRALELRGQLGSASSFDTLVDAALAAQLRSLELEGVALPPAAASALARLLRGNTLTKLRLSDCADLLAEPASAAVLAAALRANCTLTSLVFVQMSLCRAHAPGAALLDALAHHAHLQKLVWNDEHLPPDPDAAITAGVALGALVAADAPALTELFVVGSLRDAAFGPLCDALPLNTHLRSLDIGDNELSKAFARERLLPAVRANASLRKLHVDYAVEEYATADADYGQQEDEAVRFVRTRAAAEAAAAADA